MLNIPIYLDNNATTCVDERVLEAMWPFFSRHYGNASSRNHAFGWEAEEAVEYAREQVAKLIGSEAKEIIFTSGATESINIALKGVYEMYASKGNHIITVNTEHQAVLDTCEFIEKEGGSYTSLSVNSEGLINMEELEKAISPHTILIAVMFANNETGVIQPVKEIGHLAKKHGILFFTDATQAAGKIPIDVLDDQIDLLSLSAHKMYGPKGVGALYVRRKNPRVRIPALFHGGGQERGMRSGTLNVPGIVGLGKACECARLDLRSDATRIKKLRNELETALLENSANKMNGSKDHRLDNTLNCSFSHVPGATLLSDLNKWMAVSSGSACTSASLEPSHVLRAMGLPDELSKSSVRFSLGRFTTQEEIDFAIQKIKELENNWAKLSLPYSVDTAELPK